MVLNPLVGTAVEALAGTLSQKLVDIGISSANLQ
ncbi:MAG: hypothetical protein JRE65_03010 [Deltaproteobacteria bacterium]|nr:hypothetical protein [Deltaproteobacteria bacterium]